MAQTGAQAQQNTAKPCATCPADQEKPCDVDGLSITIKAFDEDDAHGAATGKRKPVPMYLQALKKMRGTPVKDKKGRVVNEPFLAAYDLVFEAIADYSSAETPKNYSDPEDLVIIEKIHASFTSPNCPKDQHAFLRIVPKTAAKELPKEGITLVRSGVNNLQITEDKKFLAPSMHYDMAAMGTGPFVVFEWIISLWLATKPKEIEIIADGCGKRAKDDKRPVNDHLKALVRIHRRDTWVIGVKIPPLGSYKDELKTDGSREKTLTYGPPGARQQVTTTSNGKTGNIGTNGPGTRELVERQVRLSATGGSQQDRMRIKSLGYKPGAYRIKFKDVEDRLSRASGFDVFIARNDREIGLEDLIPQTREAVQGARAAYQNRGLALKQVKESVKSFASAIETIKSLFDAVPKWGFYFTFDMKVFAGSVIFEWGPGYGEKLGERYYPVDTQYKFKIAMDIVNVTLTVGFGVQCMAKGTGFKAVIEGSLTFKIGLNYAFNGQDDDRKVIGVQGSCDGKLNPLLEVKVLGWTVTKAEAAVTSGLYLRGGQFVIDKKANKFGLHGTICSRPVVLTAEFRTGFWGVKKTMDPKTILRGSAIYTFK